MRKLLLVAIIANFIFASEVKVALAANVSYAFDELVQVFTKKYPHVKITPIISGSGSLNAQIKNGAPYDIFMSANMKYPQDLHVAKMTAFRPIVYAKGKLAFVSKKIQNLQDIKILLGKDVKSIAVANPTLAPYGQATIEALKNFGIYKDVKGKIIYGQSIAQTLTYALKVTSVGFVASSALYSPKLKGVKLFYKQVDEKFYTPIKQGIILLKRASKNSDAKAFYDFILSKRAKEIFKKYGYSI